MAVLLFALACADPEPLLQAVPAPQSAEAVAQARTLAELRASPGNVEAAYRKPEGVYVDVRFLGGRRYDAVRAELEEQLGAVVEERPGAGDAREIVFERATVRLVGEVIQQLDVPLPQGVRRSEALAMLGFPAATRDYTALTNEFRLLNEWGFRRIRFFRESRGSETIVRVQATRFSPTDG